MDLEKLKETLKANGVEEEKIDKILADLVEEEPVDDKDVDESQAEGDEPKGDEPLATTDEVVAVEDTPVVDEVDVTSEEGDAPQDDEVPPVPPTEEDVAPTDVPPTDEVAPTDDVAPVVPQFDPNELLGKLDAQEGLINEQAKTIEGLVTRIQSLEDALQKSGVLEKADEENVGIDEPRVPDSGSTDAHSPMSSALAKLNGNKHF